MRPNFIQAQVEFSKSRTGGWPPFPMRPCQPGCRKDTRLHKHDQIRVPFASLDVTSSFTSELAGSLRHHAERFELHEKSARVRAEASGMADLFGGIHVYTPRHFHYDSPFFVFLWRDAEWPYFAAWVGDTSVLSPYPE